MIKHLLGLLALFKEGSAEGGLHLDEVGEQFLCLWVILHKFKVLLILSALDTQALDVVEQEAADFLIFLLQFGSTLSLKIKCLECRVKNL